MKRKICLINPPTSLQGYGLFFPMALLTLAGVLKAEGIPVHLVDFDMELSRDREKNNWESFCEYFLERLDQTGCDLFGISSICANYPLAVLMIREIKKRRPGARIILGGPQPSAVPEESLAQFPWLQGVVIVIGEGERTLVDLLKSDWTQNSLRQIPGIAFLGSNGIPVKTAHRPLIDNLDEIPFPDFSLIDLEVYRRESPFISLVEAGRGCPFTCSFCSTALMWERKFRIKSPGRIYEEMRRLQQDYGIQGFSLTHDNFTTSPKYLKEFCEYFSRENKEGLRWTISARSDTLSPDKTKALHEAGCNGIYMGVDTGSARMQEVIKKHLDLEKFKERLCEAVALGISTTVSFVVGYPGETIEDLDETVRLGLRAKLLGASEVQFHRLAPLYGTDIYRETKGLLVYEPRAKSDQSRQPMEGDPELEGLIASHPEIFCSYYTIPTPVGYLNAAAIATVYCELVNKMAPVLQKVFVSTGWSPVELFFRWMQWREEFHPQRVIEEKFIFETFSDFMRTALWRHRKPKASSSAVRRPLVFLGPSLSLARAREILDADFRPPIKRGDLPKALLEGYREIGIIDGEFLQGLSVSVQEIRQALASGVKLYGASSMGALRAVETHSLGMVGVGTVYEWYRDGKVSSDDEVAMTFHSEDFSPLSDPLVNIRGWLEGAKAAGLISAGTSEQIFKAAAAAPFPQRKIHQLLKGLEGNLPPEELRSFGEFISRSGCDLKAMDAERMLALMKMDYEIPRMAVG